MLLSDSDFRRELQIQIKKQTLSKTNRVNALTILTGLIRQPKYGHLKELHKAIKLCERALVAADPTVTTLGVNQEVFAFILHFLLLTQVYIRCYSCNSNVV